MHIQIWFLHVQTSGKLDVVIYHSDSFDKSHLFAAENLSEAEADG